MSLELKPLSAEADLKMKEAQEAAAARLAEEAAKKKQEEVKKAEENTKATLQNEKPFSARESIPSTWHILPTDEDGVISATHTETGRVFEGTIAAFNILLQNKQ